MLDEHLYCCLMQGSMCDEGELPHNRLDDCKGFHHRKMLYKKKDADRLKVPIFITEWGACSDSLTCTLDMRNVQDAMDEHAASWTYW